MPKIAFAALIGACFLAPAALAADAQHGAQVYTARCGTCHALDANKIGPAHRGVVGRKAGTAPGYNYSPALKSSALTWTEANLDMWLQGPPKLVKGVKMFFSLPSPADRADVIAYLATQKVK